MLNAVLATCQTLCWIIASLLPVSAQALEAAGCFAVLIECVPPAVAAAVTRELHVPTIGIGAGPHTSGQVQLLRKVHLFQTWGSLQQ